MKLKLIFLICIVFSSQSHQPPEPYIFEGQPAAEGQFPWQVALHIPKNTGMTFCGGAIISETWILTAAHCIRSALFQIRVLVGTTQSTGDDPDQVERFSREWIVHELFDYFVYENDIGLVRLSENLLFSDYIKPISLASEDIGSDVAVTVSGWGQTSQGGPRVSDLRYSNLFTTSSTECSGIMTEGMLCAVPDPNHEAQNICGGDSGGALVVNATNPLHVGIVSTFQICERGRGAVFTRTAYYREWIRNQIDV